MNAKTEENIYRMLLQLEAQGRLLARITDALERIAPPKKEWTEAMAKAFVSSLEP